MDETITLDLPEPLLESARAVAAQSHRRIEDVLIEWLDRAATDVPVELLSDEQVLACCDLQMEPSQQALLSDLLTRQREGTLTTDERGQLDSLMGIYRRGMVRKAQALKVAVDRGLQPPLS
jgi:hypothetical protein